LPTLLDLLRLFNVQYFYLLDWKIENPWLHELRIINNLIFPLLRTNNHLCLLFIYGFINIFILNLIMYYWTICNVEVCIRFVWWMLLRYRQLLLSDWWTLVVRLWNLWGFLNVKVSDFFLVIALWPIFESELTKHALLWIRTAFIFLMGDQVLLFVPIFFRFLCWV
jgi:hypothetical protein